MNNYHTHKHRKARKVLIVKKVVKPKFIDRFVYLAAIVEPLFSLPQAYEVYQSRSAGSVSILAWLGFELMTLIWLWYGYVHRDKMILIYQSLFFIIDGSVLIGALYYHGKLF